MSQLHKKFSIYWRNRLIQNPRYDVSFDYINYTSTIIRQLPTYIFDDLIPLHNINLQDLSIYTDIKDFYSKKSKIRDVIESVKILSENIGERALKVNGILTYTPYTNRSYLLDKCSKLDNNFGRLRSAYSMIVKNGECNYQISNYCLFDHLSARPLLIISVPKKYLNYFILSVILDTPIDDRILFVHTSLDRNALNNNQKAVVNKCLQYINPENIYQVPSDILDKMYIINNAVDTKKVLSGSTTTYGDEDFIDFLNIVSNEGEAEGLNNHRIVYDCDNIRVI
jgi:hypothetical protein